MLDLTVVISEQYQVQNFSLEINNTRFVMLGNLNILSISITKFFIENLCLVCEILTNFLVIHVRQKSKTETLNCP